MHATILSWTSLTKSVENLVKTAPKKTKYEREELCTTDQGVNKQWMRDR
jgi:hypothetical protein